MLIQSGIVFALFAMLSWGFGDFYIQKVSRSIGIWKSIFFISVIGTIILAPFSIHDLHFLHSSRAILFVIAATIVALVTSLFDFEALRQGKLAIIEPIISTELPLAVLLAVVLWGETLSISSWVIIFTIFIGSILAVTEHHTQLHYHKRIYEKGVIFAVTAALCMAMLDVVMGASSKTSAPLLTVWLVSIGTGIVSFAYLLARNKFKELKTDIKNFRKDIILLGILDTCGWIGFCLASARMSIAITTAIAESYIVITILLGILLNHEKIKRHQKIGVTIVVLCVIILALIP